VFYKYNTDEVFHKYKTDEVFHKYKTDEVFHKYKTDEAFYKYKTDKAFHADMYFGSTLVYLDLKWSSVSHNKILDLLQL